MEELFVSFVVDTPTPDLEQIRCGGILLSMLKGQDYIFGKHPVFEALNSRPQAIVAIWLRDDSESREIENLAKQSHLKINRFRAGELPAGFDHNAVHQGVIALVELGGLTISYKEFMNDFTVGDNAAFALLDEIEDPQNVGAIIRSAAAFGLAGILIPEHNQAQITGSVIKVSAGMAFRIPLVSIGNVNSTLRDLKEKGYWIYGLTGEGENDLTREKFDAPAVFVVGAEGAGIRTKTLELCDIRLRIPIDERCESLNAATSASVAFYEWSRGRGKKI